MIFYLVLNLPNKDVQSAISPLKFAVLRINSVVTIPETDRLVYQTFRKPVPH
jgi:hypothetical protein